MLPARPLLAALFLLALTASPCNVCRYGRAGPPLEPAPTGPTLDQLPQHQGIVLLRFPNRPPGVTVWVSIRGGDVFPKTFPVRVAVPIGEPVSVEASSDQDSSFFEPVNLSPNHREKEIVIRLVEARWSGNYGFAKSELPTETAFIPLAQPKPGVPAAPLFLEQYSALSWNQPPFLRTHTWFLVDDRGDIWWASVRWPSRERDSAPEPAYTQLGSVETSVLERMKSLRTDAAKGTREPVPDCGGCNDCGGSGVTIHGEGIPDENGVTIATGSMECTLSSSPAAKTIAAWMVALRKQVLPLKDPPAVPNPDTRP